MSFFQTVLITKGNYFFARNQFSLQYVERAWLPFGTTAAKGEGKKALLRLSAFPWKRDSFRAERGREGRGP